MCSLQLDSFSVNTESKTGFQFVHFADENDLFEIMDDQLFRFCFLLLFWLFGSPVNWFPGLCIFVLVFLSCNWCVTYSVVIFSCWLINNHTFKLL
ncbi:hypothetical protein QVD17_28041 [Tagetes erecta]|uniref:Uncharacterized protein n=1 Tax=Tagetes erecta TaxID=13708 RepID=A0AAD8NSC9_TARER|nr:hypothetical protein QVD17_28041 [Tagetes erecta]